MIFFIIFFNRKRKVFIRQFTSNAKKNKINATFCMGSNFFNESSFFNGNNFFNKSSFSMQTFFPMQIIIRCTKFYNIKTFQGKQFFQYN
jgi:hypothetical protein